MLTMAVKHATVDLHGDALRFVGRTGSGHIIVLDDAVGDGGARPAELLPLALAGCTAMDVISILRKKQQPVTGYSVEAAGTQDDEHPNAFRSIDVTHVVEGRGIDEAAVRRAIELSATRYCSVGATLSSGRVTVTHRFVVRDPDGAVLAEGTVMTMGPFAEPQVPVLAGS